MKKEQLLSLIKEAINEEMVNLDHLHTGVPILSEIGIHWYKLVHALENVIISLQDAEDDLKSSTEPKPNIKGALYQCQLIVKVLDSIKPVILGLDDIEQKKKNFQ